MRGAFTGAQTARAGLFETANGGTIFLDEVGDLPTAAQVKLLRTLQEGEIKPVGADETRSVDVRVLSATNVDLKAKITSGEFRRDLYYRLNVIAINLPPLREREDDVVLLAAHFVQKLALRMERAPKRLGETAVRALRGHHLAEATCASSSTQSSTPSSCRKATSSKARDLPVRDGGDEAFAAAGTNHGHHQPARAQRVYALPYPDAKEARHGRLRRGLRARSARPQQRQCVRCRPPLGPRSLELSALDASPSRGGNEVRKGSVDAPAARPLDLTRRRLRRAARRGR